MRSRSLLRFALLATVALPSTALAQPNPNEVYVQSISYGGTGCQQGSVGNSFSNDRKSFTLIFDSYIASSGPSVPVTENRKNCQMNVNMHIPQGFSYSIAQFDYRGYVQLPKGVSAEQKSIYYFQGETEQASAASRFVGPVAKDYLVSDRLGLPAVVWMPCGRTVPVNINSQVRLLGAGSAQAQITTDSIDGKVKHILGFQWLQC
jgi:hypothetical protein